MTVNVVMPVHNRLSVTKHMVDRLRVQKCDERVRILIVDDGSTDGTSEYLSLQHDITVLVGNGTLWWGGAVSLALKALFREDPQNDWVLLVNNDSDVEDDFIQRLLDVARVQKPAAVGSVLHHIDDRKKLLSVGPKIDAWAFLIEDAISGLVHERRSESISSDFVEVDALSGRGVLYPLEVLRKVGGMRPRFLPHYLADYELSTRVKAVGCRLVVSMTAITYTDEVFGNSYNAPSLKEKLLSVRSPSYIPAMLAFWWGVSSKMQILTAPFRLTLFSLLPQLRQRKRRADSE